MVNSSSPAAEFERSRLLGQAKQGDQAALVSLLMVYQSLMQRVARKRIGRRLRHLIHPSSVVQESLLRIHQHGNPILADDIGAFEAWLRAIVGNVVVDRFRHHNAQKRRFSRERSIQQLGSGFLTRIVQEGQSNSPSEAVANQDEAQELMRRITHAFEGLPRHYQTILLARYEQGETPSVMARRLWTHDTPPQEAEGDLRREWKKLVEQTRMMLRRAEQALRRKVAGNGEVEGA